MRKSEGCLFAVLSGILNNASTSEFGGKCKFNPECVKLAPKQMM